MWRWVVLLLGVTLLTPVSPAAATELAATAELGSDAVFRGLDQTHGLAGSAGLDAGLATWAEISPYLGGSIARNRMAGGSEIDLYAGGSRRLVIRDLYPVSVDGGVIGYLFPQSEDGLHHRGLDAAELYSGVTLGPASLKLWLSPDYFDCGAPGGYLRAQLRWPLPASLTAMASAGVAAGPGVRRYTSVLTSDRQGHIYADGQLALEYAMRRDLTLRAAVSAVTLDLGEQAVGGSERVRFWLSARKDFDLGRL